MAAILRRFSIRDAVGNRGVEATRFQRYGPPICLIREMRKGPSAAAMNAAMIDDAKRRQARMDAKDCWREACGRRCAWMWTEYGDDWPKLVTHGLGA